MAEAAVEREFRMTDRDFDEIRELVLENTGISLSPAKRDMVYGRLARRLRAVGLNTVADYLRYLQDPANDELGNLVNAITTNLTFFFREPHHFDFLKDTAIPQARIRNKDSRRIRIWSAGCSTGEEPYSIAMVLDKLMHGTSWDVKVLATDLDTNVLETGRAGIYDEERVKDLGSLEKKKNFLVGDGKVKVKPHIQRYVSFKQLNLMAPKWPMKGPFDVIFCRNVLIYFNKETQHKLFNRYADLLVDGGYLLIGHSETMQHMGHRFKFLGRTIYTKVA